MFAACTVVLIGVGLCLKSLMNLRRVNLGFSPRDVAICSFLDLQGAHYSEQQGRVLYGRIRDAVEQFPGVVRWLHALCISHWIRVI